MIIVILGYLFFYYNPGIKVTVKNQSETIVGAIVLRCSGYDYELGSLKPSEYKDITIRPVSDSTLLLIYSKNGAMVRHEISVYVEKGYAGSINVFINKQDVTFRENVKISWF
jgi:hypothetical protein